MTLGLRPRRSWRPRLQQCLLPTALPDQTMLTHLACSNSFPPLAGRLCQALCCFCQATLQRCLLAQSRLCQPPLALLVRALWQHPHLMRARVRWCPAGPLAGPQGRVRAGTPSHPPLDCRILAAQGPGGPLRFGELVQHTAVACPSRDHHPTVACPALDLAPAWLLPPTAPPCAHCPSQTALQTGRTDGQAL